VCEQQAEERAEAEAVRCEEQSISYRELNERANQLAHYLREQGVGAESVVGILVERSIEMIVGVLGVLKAGAAYLPLDAGYPVERLRFMIEDSRTELLLTEQSLEARVGEIRVKRVCLDREAETLAEQSGENLPSIVSGENLAYVIYTSGSTGVAKGVAVRRQALNNFLQSMRERPGLSREDVLAAVTTVTFDIAALELLLPLIVGARVVVISREVARDAMKLAGALAAHQVNVMQATPSTWRMLSEAGWGGGEQFKALCGGEALSQELADRLSAGRQQLWNLYGPTETTIWSTIERIESGSAVTIGRPIANTQVYVLDKEMQPVPIGVRGELYIGGEGLARGYLDNPELTAERFVPHPGAEQPGARLYGTGDVVRWREGGRLEYLGRSDTQVKVRGHRIELAEVQRAVAEHESVSECVVARVENQLVAYVVFQSGREQPAAAELRQHARARLPEYMVPNLIVELERMPLTPNGKVDRKQLPAPEYGRLSLEQNYVAAQTPLEAAVSQLWQEVLQLERVGLHDNFFDLGGHSLLAVRVVARVKESLRVELPLRYLFEYPTVAGVSEKIKSLAQELEDGRTDEGDETNKYATLSYAQERLWFLHQLEPENPGFNLHLAVHFDGELDINALEASLNEIVKRHEALRTKFAEKGGHLVQVIRANLTLSLNQFNLEHLSGEEAEAEKSRLLKEELEHPFNLSESPLLRSVLLKFSNHEHILMLTLHHIIGDQPSLDLLVSQLMAIYDASIAGRRAELPVLPLQYADYAQWQRDRLQGTVLADQLKYWDEQLSNVPTLLEVATDHMRPPIQSYRGASESFELTPELSRSLKELSQAEGVTLFMTLLAAFQLLLAKYSGQPEIVVGSPVAGRNRKEVEGLIGLFVNTLALRTKVNGKQSFRELLRQVREVCLGAYAHQEIPFEKLVEQLQPERSLSHSPLFQVVFQLHSGLRREAATFNGVRQQGFSSKTETAKFDITLAMIDSAGGMIGNLEYNTELFNQATAARIASHFINLLAAASSAPDTAVASLSMLSNAERSQLLVDWNDTAGDYPRQFCVHHLFEQQAERRPDAVAVVSEDEQLTYGELNSRANQLAHYLRSLGVGPDSLVGVLTARSPRMIVSLLAILKAGGGYLPLNPEYPVERLRQMMENSGARWLLMGSGMTAEWADDAVRLVRLAEEWTQVEKQSRENPISVVSVQNLAYVLYTSGSSGEPKGVQIEHSSLANLLNAMLRQPGLCADDVVVAITALSFDIAALELFLPLVCGARVLLVSRGVATDGVALARLIKESRATLVQATPSTWRMLVETGWSGEERLKALCGGEPLSQELADALCERVGELWNMYGPTETTIWSATARITSGREVNIGRGIPNTQLYVLDEAMEPVAIGVSGELHIGGEGLARGYLGRAALTAERFVPDHLTGDAGGRLYRSGDVVRWSVDGRLEYLRRADKQVKVRGHRVELEEIEAMLTAHERVREAAVVVLGNGSEERLAAYVVSASEVELNMVELRDYLRSKLPGYMIPSQFLLIDEIPLTVHGKLDYRRLAAMKAQPAQVSTAVIKPRTDIEVKLAQVWRELLQIETISISRNFFDLGGHSLLLIRLSHELEEIFPVKIQLVDLFQYPTIELLAGWLSQKLTGNWQAGESGELPESSARRGALRKPARETTSMSFSEESIAIIGLSCRVPGASNAEQYWENLRDGRETISRFSDEELRAEGITQELLSDPSYVKAKGVLEEIEMFDAQFFGFSPKEAAILDPQHRLFLECAWQALEIAGYDADRYQGRIGVYAGQSMSTYLLRLLSNSELIRSAGEFPIIVANRDDFLATRVCYKLNLKGPGVVVQSACSTSLVAVVMACQSLLQGDSDIALAGGVSVGVPHKTGYIYEREGIHSADGHCRAFDERAQGCVDGDGVGVVALKRLSDALADGDLIQAVIRGATINNDGSTKMGYTAPSLDGQSEVIALAQSMAGVDPETISYVETHGTGTALGDPIEIAALTQAFRTQTQKQGFCAIGSVKTNVGHLDAAAGVAGLIKTVLAFKHKQLPPSLHFERPNPRIDFDNSPFYVNTTLREWTRPNGTPLRAGVSSFGIGGTNAHLVLEEAPAIAKVGASRAEQLLVLSARSRTALEQATTNLSLFLKEHPKISLADVAYTLKVGRKEFTHRRALVCRDAQDAAAALDTLDPGRVFTSLEEPPSHSVAFMFPGQGAQHVGMGRQLYQAEPVFREQLDKCAQLLEPHLGLDLRELLYPDFEAQPEKAASRIRQTAVAQPALFAVEYALARLWMSWGIQPAALLGHSIGEYVAACLAGVFSLADALRLIAARGRLMQQMPAGKMLVVPLPESEVLLLLNTRLSLAAVNSPSLCVVAGPVDDICELETLLAKRDVDSVRLNTSHAFHSWMMTEALDPFAEEVKKSRLSPPKIPFVSNLTGDWITAEQATDSGYWVRQLGGTVRFGDGVAQLFKETNMALLEVGPGHSLTNIVRWHAAKSPEQLVLSSLPRHDEGGAGGMTRLLNSLSQLWISGVEIDWAGFYAGERRLRVELPTYPFERQRYWVEAVRRPTRRQRATPQGNEVNSVSLNGKAVGASKVGVQINMSLPDSPQSGERLQPLKFDEALGQAGQGQKQEAAHGRPRLSTAYEKPGNDLEKALAELWEELIGVKGLGVYDNFFELGGHSLLGTMLMTRLRKMFRVNLALQTLFEGPTIAELALAIEESLIREVESLSRHADTQPV
jgi:amino acid adenylation domain-containing protein